MATNGPEVPRVKTWLCAMWVLAFGASTAAARAPVIDVHVHTAPEHYPLLADVLASIGITRFVNLSGGSAGDGLDESLDAAAPLDGRVIVCANLRWREYARPDFAKRQVMLLEEAKRLGARCLKVPKVLGLGVPDPDDPNQYMAVDDPRLDPIWAAAGRLGFPVFIHTGDPKAFFEPLGPENERMAELGVHPEWSFADPKYPRREALLAARDRVLERHPETIFIGVHLANNPEDIDYVARTLEAHPNLYVDVAARLPEIGRHDPAKVRALFIRFQDRILFGTDLGFHQRSIMLGSVGKDRPRLIDIFWYYAVHFWWFESNDRQIPLPTPIQGDWRIDSIGLPEAVLDKIYSGNALRLLWGEAGPSKLDAEAIETAPGMPAFFE
ncbi:MAG: amidohydrolase family protein [Myxococcales bacterium]|nr:amidohydrolase family protein [Myxococcales bacterium]